MIPEAIAELEGTNVRWAEHGGECPDEPVSQGITGGREELIAFILADSKRWHCVDYIVLPKAGGFSVWRR